MKWLLGLLVVCTAGCGILGDDAGAAECSIDGLTEMATVTMDGDTWSSDGGSWNRTADGIQINLPFQETERTMTVRGSRDQGGADIVDQIDAEEFPIIVSLGGEDGTGQVMDSRFQSSYASNQPGGSGSLSILDVQGSTMSACFSFVAATDDGELMEVTEGMVEVDELN